MELNQDVNTNDVEDKEAKRRRQNRERQRRRRQKLAMQQTTNVAEPSTPEVNAPLPEHTDSAVAQQTHTMEFSTSLDVTTPPQSAVAPQDEPLGAQRGVKDPRLSKRRLNETESQKKKRQERERLRIKERRAKETVSTTKERQKRDREYHKKARSEETPQTKRTRHQLDSHRHACIRQEETPGTRALRRARDKEEHAQARQEETPGTRVQRRARDREEHAQARQEETPGTRAQRRARDREEHAQAREEETPGTRAQRRERDRAQHAQSFAQRSPCTRETGLVIRRVQVQRRLSFESPTHRQARQALNRSIQQHLRQDETREQRMLRRQRDLARHHDAREQSHVEKEEYLQSFDAARYGPLHQQSWMLEQMKAFEQEMCAINMRWCTLCKEHWAHRGSDRGELMGFVCEQCCNAQRNGVVPKFSAANNMDPGEVPQELKGLTMVEEMLIALACPIMTVRRLKGGQTGYSGQVINMPQDVAQFATELPRDVHDLPILIIRRKDQRNNLLDCRVRRNHVIRALGWLQAHNAFYRQITVVPYRVEALPQNGVPDGLAYFEEDDVPEARPVSTRGPREVQNTQDSGIVDQRASGSGEGQREGRDIQASEGVANTTEANAEVQAEVPEETFIGEHERRALERNQIMATLNSRAPIIDWPSMGNRPINEFTEVCLAAKCFPTLFPTGAGDPTSREREVPVSEADAFRHLMKYGEKDEDGKMTWRFASHPRFTHWANNRLQRHRLLGQSKVFLERTPEVAQLTLEELRERSRGPQAHHLLNQMYRFGANLTGSDQYWYRKRGELEAIFNQEGAATMLFYILR